MRIQISNPNAQDADVLSPIEPLSSAQTLRTYSFDVTLKNSCFSVAMIMIGTCDGIGKLVCDDNLQCLVKLLSKPTNQFFPFSSA